MIMKESFCLAVLLCVYVVNGQVCIRQDDRKDVQIMPGCSMQTVVGKTVKHFQMYLYGYPSFPNQLVCGKATQDLLTGIISDAMDCMVGTCTEGVITNTIAYAADPVLARQMQLMQRDELMAAMERTKQILGAQVQMNASDVGMVCPENPTQPPPLINHLALIQQMFGIDNSKVNNLAVVMGVLFQRPEVFQMKPADMSVCRFFSNNVRTTFDGADLKPFIMMLIYKTLEAMGLGNNVDVAAVIDLNMLSEKGKMMIVEALEAPFCQDHCKIPTLPYVTANIQQTYIQSGAVTFSCPRGYFTPQPRVRSCVNAKFNYRFNREPLQCFREVDYPNSVMKQRLSNLLNANKKAGVFDESVTLAEVLQHYQNSKKVVAQKVSGASRKTSITPVIFGCLFVVLFAQLMLPSE